MPNGVVMLSFSASITASVTLALLLATLPSLAALVAPFTPTLVCAVSLPPLAPGIVTVIGQLIVPPAGTLAAEPPALYVHTPLATTVAPAGTPAANVQVGLLAAVATATLVHTTVPFNTAPGPAVNGRPVTATLMSDALTVIVTIAVSQTA